MERPIKEGVLIIDKPKGMTSHDIVLIARKCFKISKIGHIGTLDPLATGVLPICIGEATKLSPFLTDQEKEYIATIKFGEETDTLDSEGKVIFRSKGKPSDKDKIIEVIEGFKGKIQQTPPLFSAIKRGGIPLYRLARRGIKVDVQPREVEIQDIEILSLHLPYVTFRVLCSSGTYIRALCRDIGREAGWRGHLVSLRRIRSGSFSLDNSITVEILQNGDRPYIKRKMIPISSLLEDIPYLEVEKDIEDKLRRGWQPFFRSFSLSGFNAGERIRFLSKDGRLISIAEIKGFEREKKKVSTETNLENNGYSNLSFKLLRVFNY